MTLLVLTCTNLSQIKDQVTLTQLNNPSAPAVSVPLGEGEGGWQVNKGDDTALKLPTAYATPYCKKSRFCCHVWETCFAFQESSNGPVKKSMREKAIERRSINKEHNSNFKAGYVPIEEERLHKTGLRGRKGNMAVCIVVLLFLLALINLIVSNTRLSVLDS